LDFLAESSSFLIGLTLIEALLMESLMDSFNCRLVGVSENSFLGSDLAMQILIFCVLL
jgi:hypothetical protein